VLFFQYILIDYDDSELKNSSVNPSINTVSLFLLTRMNLVLNQHLTNAIIIPPLRLAGKLLRDDLIHYETSVMEFQQSLLIQLQ